jgi:hypothetical protein
MSQPMSQHKAVVDAAVSVIEQAQALVENAFPQHQADDVRRGGQKAFSVLNASGAHISPESLLDQYRKST